MMNKFVTYPLALKLEQLGFDEECECFWDDENTIDTFIFLDDGKNKNSTKEHPRIITAPTWQDAFDWFLEKFNLLAYPVKYIDWYYTVDKIDEKYCETIIVEQTSLFKTIYEARIACVELLIELIEEGRKK